MRVVDIDPQADARWRGYLLEHPLGSIYHHPLWSEVIRQAYGYKVYNLACEDTNGRVRGIAALAYRRGLLRGHRLSALPSESVAGPLADDEEAVAALIGAGLERQRTDTRLELGTTHAGLEQLVDGVVRVAEWPTYVLRLTTPADELRFGNARNHARLKNMVKKATRLGVRVRVAEELNDLRCWYQLYLSTVRDHLAPPQPFRFFRVLWELLRPSGLMRLLLAERHNAGEARIVAGSLFLMSGQTVTYEYNARAREALALGANEAIQWQAIHDVSKAGYTRYDLGTAGSPGLAAFKTKWGAKATPIYLYRFPGSPETNGSSPHGLSTSVALRGLVWGRLPVRATAGLALLRRYA